MPKRDIHVVKHEKGWATKKEGSKRAGSLSRTQNEAIQKAKGQAKREGAEVVIHGRDGRIRDSDTYGPDPFPPRDKKH